MEMRGICASLFSWKKFRLNISFPQIYNNNYVYFIGGKFEEMTQILNIYLNIIFRCIRYNQFLSSMLAYLSLSN